MEQEDKEIKKSDEDILNRKNFANYLAINIQNYLNKKDVNNCLTIGLIGEWGSGKTSILNMTEEFLKEDKQIKMSPT